MEEYFIIRLLNVLLSSPGKFKYYQESGYGLEYITKNVGSTSFVTKVSMHTYCSEVVVVKTFKEIEPD